MVIRVIEFKNLITINIHEVCIFFQAHFFSPKILQHYCLIWLSIITSPKGKQLDFWLFFAVFMDCAPVVISIYNTINYALWLRNMGKQISFLNTCAIRKSHLHVIHLGPLFSYPYS